MLLAVVFAVAGGFGGGLFGTGVSSEQFKAIHTGDTPENLEERLGPAEWGPPLRVGPEDARPPQTRAP